MNPTSLHCLRLSWGEGMSLCEALPTVAVIIGQSSGKSSVLESVVGRDFLPCNVTRRPMVLQLLKVHWQAGCAEFLHAPKRRYTNFAAVRKEISDETDRITRRTKQICNHPIHLSIYSPNVVNLTPHRFSWPAKVTVEGQSESIVEGIEQMVRSYFENRLPQLNSSSSSACSYAPNSGNCDAFVPDQFPAGLRVMVVDDDVTCLRILEQMLKRCNYVVTTFSQATVALNLLRERKGCFDLVLSDVHMPDMDGFKLLELVGLEMDLPVIMISADEMSSTVMRGIKHGACDYLIKPIREEELKTIWQHVVRKKWNESREHDNSGSLDDNDRRKRGSDDAEYVSSVNEGSESILTAQKKRRDVKEEDDEVENDDPAASKKPRVVWSVELHQQFVSAVDQLGIDKAVPKRILELMNIPGLTRENVASHLQKFRLYLKRLSVLAPQQGGNGNPNSFYAPLEQNSKLGPLGRYNFQALAASDQIPLQSLAALQAELLGRPIGSLVLPVMEQPTLLQASLVGQKSSPVEQGQPLMKCSSNISKPLTQNITSPENDHLGFGAWVPNSLSTLGTSSNLTGIVAQNGNVSVSRFQNQQQQHVQQHQKKSILQEPTRSINVQPSFLVVPSQSPSSQDRNGSHLANQSYSFNVSSVISYNLHSPQSNNSSLSVGQMLDLDLKTTGVLCGYSDPSPCFPSMSCCSENAATGAQGPTFGATMAGENDITYNVNFNQILDCGPLRNLGFVGKGTSASSRFAVDETESPLSHYSHGNTYWDNNSRKVKQELNVDFSENSKLGNPILHHFSPNDTMNVLFD